MSLAHLYAVDESAEAKAEALREVHQEELRDLAGELEQAFSHLIPEIHDRAECLDSALDVGAFLDEAGIERQLFYGSLSTTETGEIRPTRIICHWWIEIPLEGTKIYVDLTLPHWLTDPAETETDFQIPTVMTEEDSSAFGRRYEGDTVDFPDLCGTSESGHFKVFPREWHLSDGIHRRYLALAPMRLREQSDAE